MDKNEKKTKDTKTKDSKTNAVKKPNKSNGSAKKNTEKKISDHRDNHKKKQTHPMNYKDYLKNINTYFILALLIAMITFMVLLHIFNVLPIKYIVLVGLGMTIFAVLMAWMQFSSKISKFNRILGKILIAVITVALCIGCWYIQQADEAIDKITVLPGDEEHEVISVVVEKDSKAEELKDVTDGIFAVPETIDIEHTNATVEDINKQLNKEITTKAYTNTNDQAKALFDHEADAMILNEAYRSLLDENYPSFDEDTKVIYTFRIAKEVKNIVQKVDVNSQPYNVYISGIDTYGPIATKSRSDVNMIATINPNTKQVLLTSIPRDYYVAQPCQGNQYDKLTHTGIFGVDCTVESVQNLTGVTINYYVRVNFSSLENIVNALDGIDIYNMMDFYSGVDGEYIPAGYIHIYGNTALKFARERHAYADGDRQRGRNQMIVLEAIVQKALSPAIITGYSGIMDAVGDNFQTNMTKEEMTSIIKNQIDFGGSWNIVQQSVTGEGGTDWTPANGFNAYVMYPDQYSVDVAVANIQAVMNGQIVELP